MVSREKCRFVRSAAFYAVFAVFIVGGLAACQKKGDTKTEKAKEKKMPEPDSPEKSASAKTGEGQPGEDDEAERLTDQQIAKFAEIGVRVKAYQEKLGEPSGTDKKAKLQHMMKVKKKMQEVLADVGFDQATYRRIAARIEEDEAAQKRFEQKVQELTRADAGSEDVE